MSTTRCRRSGAAGRSGDLGRSRAVAGVGSVIALALVLTTTSCSSSASVDASIGKIRPIDQGTAITVPALWAAQQSDGSKVGGIEPAEVQVLNNDDGKFTVDTSTIESRGAGPQWKAATSQAAAVGTLISGVDPATIDLGFTVTGPIDGPSAGGLLTVGVLADIQGDELLPGVTMTGTISPDGSIGAVGYVPTKLAAAAAAGFTTAVIPAGLGKFVDVDGSSKSLVAYGESIGIAVKEVRTVAQAYQIMTGKPFAQVPQNPVVASASSSAVMVATTKQMLVTLKAAVTAAPSGTDAEVMTMARAAIVTMNSKIAAGQWDQAYGVGGFAFLRLARATGAAKVNANIKQGGVALAERALRSEIAIALKEAVVARDAAIDDVALTVEQSLSLPGALGWATFAIACYQGLLLEFEKDNSAEALTVAGRVLEENRAGVEVMLPDALAVLNSQPSVTPANAAKVTKFLKGYTILLNDAGAANLNYYTVLSGNQLNPSGTVAKDGLIAASRALKQSSAAMPDAKTLSQALRQASNALAYFVISSGVLSSNQAYGLESSTDDLRFIANPQALDAAVSVGSATVESYSQELRAKNLTVGYPLWSSRWGKAAADHYRKTNLAGEAGWVGLNEIWYDAVSMFMMNAFTQPA